MTIASGTCGVSATWRLEDDGTLYIEGTGAMEDYTSNNIQPWNSYLSQITGVVIGEGITHVGNNAFYGHTAMTSVTFPSTLESIGDITNNRGAFYRCVALKDVVFPDSLTLIGNYSFHSCVSLTSIDLGNVETIGNYCFYGCTSLTEAISSNNVVSIGDYAFYNCTNLESFDFNNTQEIGSNCFYFCKFVSINLPSIQTIDSSAFNFCMSLENITFGPDLISVGSSAFSRHYNPKPSSSDILQRTFTFLGPKPTFGSSAIGLYTYYGGGSGTDGSIAITTGFSSEERNFIATCYTRKFGDNITYTVDGEILTLDGSGEMWTFEDGCNVPYDARSCTSVFVSPEIIINSTALYLFKTIPHLSLPSLTEIGDEAFKSNTKLVSIDISGATSIGASAFYGCSKLEKVNISGASTIGVQAFYTCGALHGIKIPSAVTIGKQAFYNCSDLRSIDISSPVLTTIGDHAFYNHKCHGIIIPASVTSIGANALTPYSNSYRKHMTIVFRGTRISGTYTAPTGMMIHEFCKNEAENDNNADYAAGTVNSSHPVMIRTAGGWRVISTDMIDNT